MLFLALLLLGADAFQLSSTRISHRLVPLTAHFDEAGTAVLAADAAAAERYVATNRFKVKPGQGFKFEKRWADRKSRLSELDGFRFFTLLRRIGDDGVGEYVGNDPEYVSFTVWENKDNFDAWRQGDAFREAHGGTGFAAISGFVQLLTTALFILEGALVVVGLAYCFKVFSPTHIVHLLGGPKPAFYDGLMPIVNDASVFSPFVVEGGWRKVPADGVNPLPVDVFAVQTRFAVAEGKETAFEKGFAERENRMIKDTPGFMFFHLQRRDALKADDGYNFVSTTFWKDKAAFEAWRALPQSGAHGSAPIGEVVGRPSIAMYEGKLALASPRGA